MHGAMPDPAPPCGVLNGPLHRFAVRVYFEDTDLSGVVYHANYLRWFERARSDMLRLAGIDQRAAHDAGRGAYAVVAMQLDWRRPARLDDAVLIETRVKTVSAARIGLAQAALRGETVLCAARLTVAFVSPAGRPLRQPADWLARFGALVDQDPVDVSQHES